MSDASLIQTLTLNQPSYFTTPTGIDRVKVHNDSGYYLRVYFGLGAPSSATGSGWHGTVSPGASPVLPVVGASTSTEGLDLTNSRTTGVYQGQVIILPFLPAGAQLSSGGVITGSSLCFLTSYYPGEYAEPGGQIDAYVQGAKQQRVQSVGGGILRYMCDTTQANPNPVMSLTVAGSVFWTFSPVDQPNLFAANTAGPSWVFTYIYGFHCDFDVTSAGGSVYIFHLQLQITSAGGGVVRNQRGFGVYRVGSPTNAQHEHLDHCPSRPLVVGLALNQNTLAVNDELRVLLVSDGTANNWALRANLDFSVDIVNQYPLFEIPSEAFGGAGNAVYNPAYNPQTW